MLECLFTIIGCAAKTTANGTCSVQPKVCSREEVFGEGICSTEMSGRNVWGKLPGWEISRRKSPGKMTGSPCSITSLHVQQL